jgi:CBS domain-containing protein
MSARAASRLETLGFSRVHRYQPGKADWAAAGLPLEGKKANVKRVKDVARRDVPTCRIDEPIGALRDRVQRGGWDVCVVVDERRVVLGVVLAESLDADPNTLVEQVMQSDAVTFRPNLVVGEMPDYLKKRRIPRALVTTSDGVLVGLLRIDDVEAYKSPQVVIPKRTRGGTK